MKAEKPGWQLWFFMLQDNTLYMKSDIADQSGKLIAYGPERPRYTTPIKDPSGMITKAF